jgi:hypothetical protein
VDGNGQECKLSYGRAQSLLGGDFYSLISRSIIWGVVELEVVALSSGVEGKSGGGLTSNYLNEYYPVRFQFAYNKRNCLLNVRPVGMPR